MDTGREQIAVDTEPPPDHPIQELGLDVEPGGDVWEGDALIPAGACTPGTRFPLASVLVLYADMIAGAQIRAMTLPRLSVTVDLSLDVVDPGVYHRPVGELSLRSRVLRAGKRMFVTETAFAEPGGPLVALCTGSFSAISRTDDAVRDAVPVTAPRHQRRLLQVPLADRVGVTSPGPGIAEVALGPNMGNSTKSLMGGFTALLAESAALSAIASPDGDPGGTSSAHVADRLHIRYLAPVTAGPARAVVRRRGGAADRPLLFVEVRDSGRADDLAADVSVGCVRIG